MKSKLNQNEKYIVQGRMHAGDSVADIAKSIKRQTKTVQSFVDNELDQIHETIAKVQLEQAKQVEQNKKTKAKVKKKPKRQPKNTGFINETGGGQKGISVSTDAASTQSDELKKRYPNGLARTVKGNLYNIDDQETINE